MIFRKAIYSDLDKIINIHKESFPKGIQTYMGNEYLKQKYLFLIKCSEINIVCEINGEVIGFSFSTPKPEYKLKLYLNNYFKILLSFIKHLSIVLNLIYGRLKLYFNKEYLNSKEFYKKNYIELGYIAISNTQRSNGLGSKLIREFEQIAKNKFGYSKIMTRTHNERLTNFYLKNKNALIKNKKSSNNDYTCTLIWNIKN